MTNREKYNDKTLKETLAAFDNGCDNFDFFGWLTKDADAPAAKPKDDAEKPSSLASDLGAKIGLAMLPLADLASGGKTPGINVWVICNK